MMHDVPDPLVSRARNGEDVVLLRTLGHLAEKRYALLAANPGAQSWTGTLDERGWTGEHLDAGGAGSLSGAVSQLAGTAVLHALWCAVPHGAQDVFTSLRSTDLRPWVVLVEVSRDGDDSVDAIARDLGYVPCLDDGVSRYFLAQEHAELTAALSYPACSRDDFVTSREAETGARNEALLAQVVQWRRLAVTGWADAVADRVALAGGFEAGDVAQLQRELDTLRATVSWRVTRPLRAARRLLGRLRS